MAPSLEIDGIRLEARWVGPDAEQSPTIVLLHEGLGCVALWKDFPERIAAATGLGVVAYSRAGYGASDPALLPRPLDFMHDEAQRVLPQVLDQLGITRALLVGHSDGGSIALIHAATARPTRALGIVALAPHVFVEERTLASIRDAAVAYRETELRARLEKYHARNVDVAFWGWNRVWLDPEFAAWNIEDLLPRIEIPALVIQGDADPYGSLAQVESIRAGSGGGVRTQILPGCGHAPHVQRAEATLAAIAAFASDLIAADLIAATEGGT